jgi:pimeloyl-ACP methyl ester carboxylesterase
MFDFQAQLVFPAHAVPSAGPLPPGSERLQVPVPNGPTLHGIHVPPVQRAKGDRTLLLGFGGNAWNGEDVASYLHEVFPDIDVVAFHYRGYAPSGGSPSAEALLADAPLVYDCAVDRLKPDRVVAIGLSVGSGIAAHLATQRKLDGLILVTPFDSLKAVAQGMYPWLPIGPFFEHEIDAGAAVARASQPVAIIAAERDEIVPSPRTDALRALVPDLRFDRTVTGAGHNDIYARSDFHAAIREALAAVTAEASA